MRRAIGIAVLVIWMSAPGRLPAQASSGGGLTAVLVSGPGVGRRAPTFRLPWADRHGIGPSVEPYDLSLDRGRTVVLAFYANDFARSSVAQMRTLAEQYNSSFGPEVVVVGISADPLREHHRLAASLNLPFRLLSDPTQHVARRYASNVRPGSMRQSVYVVGPDGLVHYRNLRFNALDARHYTELRAAVRRIRRG